MNLIMLSGNLTREPVTRETSGGQKVVGLGIAVKKARKNPLTGENDVDFFNASVFGKSAEYVANYAHKGDMVEIVGRIESKKYTKNEVEYTSWEVMCDKVDIITKRSAAQPSQPIRNPSEPTMSAGDDDMPW